MEASAGIYSYLYSILNLIYFPFVSSSLWMRKKLIMFSKAMRKSVILAVMSLINGDTVPPTVPMMLIHPKLTDVISAGYSSAIKTKKMPQTAFNVILRQASTIISRTETAFTSSS